MNLWIFFVWSSFFGHFCCFIRGQGTEYEDYIYIYLGGRGGGGWGAKSIFI